MKWSALIIFIGLWYLASQFYTIEQLPSPLAVYEGMTELALSGMLWDHIQVSLLRFTISYGVAVLLAVPLGIILGWYLRLWQACNALIEILRPISPMAWFPLAVLWFGVGDAPAVFIIFLAAFFPILLSTVRAVRKVDPTYLKVARNFGANQYAVFTKIVLPAAFPYIMTGLHIAVGTAWIHLVAGEMLGAQSGLGYLIVDSRNFLRTDWIIGGMITVGLLGLAINWIMSWMERKISTRWGLA